MLAPGRLGVMIKRAELKRARRSVRPTMYLHSAHQPLLISVDVSLLRLLKHSEEEQKIAVDAREASLCLRTHKEHTESSSGACDPLFICPPFCTQHGQVNRISQKFVAHPDSLTQQASREPVTGTRCSTTRVNLIAVRPLTSANTTNP
jgi:hypothetical protein